MSKLQLIKYVTQVKSGRALFQERRAFPQPYHISKYCIHSTKNKEKQQDNDVEDFDKPIKFSTSKAAKFPAAYTAARGLPMYQTVIILFSLTIFSIYFGILREENDIDENMVKNIPAELLEQIYGKEGAKVRTRVN